MSGIYFIHWVYYHFIFSKKFQKLDIDLNECFQKLEVILESLKCQEEIFVNNYIPLSPDDFYTKSKLQDVLCRPSQYFANAEIKNFDIIYHDLHQNKIDQSLEHYQTITKDRFKDFDWRMTDYLTTFACRAERDDLFFEKGFDHELFEKKNSAYFLVCNKEKN